MKRPTKVVGVKLLLKIIVRGENVTCPGTTTRTCRFSIAIAENIFWLKI